MAFPDLPLQARDVAVFVVGVPAAEVLGGLGEEPAVEFGVFDVAVGEGHVGAAEVAAARVVFGIEHDETGGPVDRLGAAKDGRFEQHSLDNIDRNKAVAQGEEIGRIPDLRFADGSGPSGARAKDEGSAEPHGLWLAKGVEGGAFGVVAVTVIESAAMERSFGIGIGGVGLVRWATEDGSQLAPCITAEMMLPGRPGMDFIEGEGVLAIVVIGVKPESQGELF